MDLFSLKYNGGDVWPYFVLCKQDCSRSGVERGVGCNSQSNEW